MATAYEVTYSIYFQRAATDALQTMTTVLKEESSAGESYEALFDGAKSLMSGLGGVLRVSSHGARLYNYTSSEKSADSAILNRRRRSFKEWILSFVNYLSRRSKRDIASEQLQKQKEVMGVLNGIKNIYIYVVVQFYPWFDFDSPLFFSILIYDYMIMRSNKGKSKLNQG